MARPRWMILRDEKRAAKLEAFEAYKAEMNEKIHDAVEELRAKVNKIEDERERTLEMNEVDNIIQSFDRALIESSNLHQTQNQTKRLYELIYSRIQGMINTLEEIYGNTISQGHK